MRVVADEVMQAAWIEAFGGPEVIQVGERPRPIRQHGKVLVRMARCDTQSPRHLSAAGDGARGNRRVSSILIDLVASVTDVPASELNAQSGPSEVRTWDSLAHVTIVAAVEQMFGVRFSMPEILAIRSIEGLRQLLEQRGVTDLDGVRT